MADDVNQLGTGDPASGDANNVPADFLQLKDAINAGSILRRLTTAQRDALGAAQKPVGVAIYNTTLGRIQMWNGSAWVNVSHGSFVVNDDGSVGVTFSGASGGGLTLNTSSGTLGARLTFSESGAEQWQIVRLTDGSADLMIGTRGGGVGQVLRFVYATGRAWLSRQTQVADAADSIVTKGYVDGLGTWSAWTPTLTASVTNPTSSAVAAECRYVQNGKTVIGKAQITVTAAGSGIYRIPLPVAPAATAVSAKRIGSIQIDAGGNVQHFLLEQVNGQTYCQCVAFSGSKSGVVYLDGTRAGLFLADGATKITYEFTYEAA